MRWERLFGELEGQAEHLRRAERDALVAELREGEWADRSWLDGLAEGTDVEIGVRDVGTMAGRVRLANQHLIHLETAAADHVVASSAVQWLRGADRSVGVAADTVAARLGWGPVFRAAADEGSTVRLTLAGGLSFEGTVAAVGRDFVRLAPVSGSARVFPAAAIRLATFGR